jgi:1-acyl-sn-glycerol-3-phosphate acyltransferase
MAMAEFFPMPVIGPFLRAVDAFPADRYRAERSTIRTAIERLNAGRIVGVFPEGGIRDGENSLLNGAPLRPGATTLAQIAGAPIVPCVIVGTDRFYARRNWIPFRRTPVWIAFGDAIEQPMNLDKSAARGKLESELVRAFQNLYGEIRQTFGLTNDDLPQSPRLRMASQV